MTNGYAEGRIFLSFPHTNNGFIFLLTTFFLFINFKISCQESLYTLRCNFTRWRYLTSWKRLYGKDFLYQDKISYILIRYARNVVPNVWRSFSVNAKWLSRALPYCHFTAMLQSFQPTGAARGVLYKPNIICYTAGKSTLAPTMCVLR